MINLVCYLVPVIKIQAELDSQAIKFPATIVEVCMIVILLHYGHIFRPGTEAVL